MWLMERAGDPKSEVVTQLTRLTKPLAGDQVEALWLRQGDDGLVAAAVVNINDFKTVNDNLGFAVGDAVLAETTRRLDTALDNRFIMCRPLGDAYAVFIPDADATIAIAIAGEALRVFDQPFHVRRGNTQTLALSARAGVAASRAGDASWSHLVTRADIACGSSTGSGTMRVREWDEESMWDLFPQSNLGAP